MIVSLATGNADPLEPILSHRPRASLFESSILGGEGVPSDAVRLLSVSTGGSSNIGLVRNGLKMIRLAADVVLAEVIKFWAGVANPQPVGHTVDQGSASVLVSDAAVTTLVGGAAPFQTSLAAVGPGRTALEPPNEPRLYCAVSSRHETILSDVDPMDVN